MHQWLGKIMYTICTIRKVCLDKFVLSVLEFCVSKIGDGMKHRQGHCVYIISFLSVVDFMNPFISSGETNYCTLYEKISFLGLLYASHEHLRFYLFSFSARCEFPCHKIKSVCTKCSGKVHLELLIFSVDAFCLRLSSIPCCCTKRHWEYR